MIWPRTGATIASVGGDREVQTSIDVTLKKGQPPITVTKVLTGAGNGEAILRSGA